METYNEELRTPPLALIALRGRAEEVATWFNHGAHLGRFKLLPPSLHPNEACG
jgi:hypothetical protein